MPISYRTKIFRPSSNRPLLFSLPLTELGQLTVACHTIYVDYIVSVFCVDLSLWFAYARIIHNDLFPSIRNQLVLPVCLFGFLFSSQNVADWLHQPEIWPTANPALNIQCQTIDPRMMWIVACMKATLWEIAVQFYPRRHVLKDNSKHQTPMMWRPRHGHLKPLPVSSSQILRTNLDPDELRIVH